MLVAMGIAGMLEDLGHEVTEASSAEQALSLLDEGLQVDMLITDQGMAGISGIELAAVVRQRISVPVLFVTGYLTLPGKAEPEWAVLRKPFRTSDLADAIGRVMRENVEAVIQRPGAAD